MKNYSEKFEAFLSEVELEKQEHLNGLRYDLIASVPLRPNQEAMLLEKSAFDTNLERFVGKLDEQKFAEGVVMVIALPRDCEAVLDEVHVGYRFRLESAWPGSRRAWVVKVTIWDPRPRLHTFFQKVCHINRPLSDEAIHDILSLAEEKGGTLELTCLAPTRMASKLLTSDEEMMVKSLHTEEVEGNRPACYVFFPVPGRLSVISAETTDCRDLTYRAVR